MRWCPTTDGRGRTLAAGGQVELRWMSRRPGQVYSMDLPLLHLLLHRSLESFRITLDISWTGVSGPVPSSLGALKKLAHLDLSFNSHSGAIPVALGAIPGITLSRNRLSGTIPPKFLSESAGRDVYLDVSHNNLTGAIPAAFAAVNFTHLDLSRNALTGDASRLFGRGKELQYIDLSRNAFDFDLSGVVVLPEKIFHLDLSHNAIHGSIPAQVADVANLLAFNVSYNRLCGPVPAGGNMARFDLYSFQHNKCLCGAPLPPCKKYMGLYILLGLTE